MAIKIEFNFVPFPRQIWDDSIELSHNGFRLLGYLLRHLVGFNNEQIKLSDDEIINGRKHRDGERYDKGSGIKSRNGLKEAREELESLGWISVETDDSDKARVKRYYSVVIERTETGKKDSQNSNTTKVNSQCQKMTPTYQTLTGDAQKMIPGVSKNDTHVSNFDTRTNIKDLRNFKEETLKEETSKELISEAKAIRDEPASEASPLPIPKLFVEPGKEPLKISNSQQELLQAFAELRRINTKVYPWARIAKDAEPYSKMGVTAADVRKFSLYWYTQHYFGLQNKPPTKSQIAELWDTALSWQQLDEPPTSDNTSMATLQQAQQIENFRHSQQQKLIPNKAIQTQNMIDAIFDAGRRKTGV